MEADKCKTLLTKRGNVLDTLESLIENDVDSVCLKTPAISCKNEECIAGIDEAGRGPVLGPMVYGICYCLKSKENVLKSLGCADSKSLTDQKRRDILKAMCNEDEDAVGWAVDVISPSKISNCQLKRNKVSLNEISHNAAIQLIKLLVDDGVNVKSVFIDTVGPPEKYQEKVSKIFPGINVTVSKKADSLFPIVSAASICAKVTRDLAVESWTFTENVSIDETDKWGSGYPGDPVTKKFLTDNLDKIFGFPRIVRFKWSTTEKILEEDAAKVYWSDDDDDEDDSNPSMMLYLNKSKDKKHRFFEDRSMESTSVL